MLGSTGPRMLRIGLPHVDQWNVWWSDYGNSPAQFAALRERVEAAAVDAGRAPGEVGATAAVLVQLAGGAGRVMGDSAYKTAVTPVPGVPAAIAEHLRGDGRGRSGARAAGPRPDHGGQHRHGCGGRGDAGPGVTAT